MTEPNKTQKRIDDLEAALISIMSHMTIIARHKTVVENIVRQQFTDKEFRRRVNGAKPGSKKLDHVYEHFEELRKQFERGR